jgi:hypothetical protein
MFQPRGLHQPLARLYNWLIDRLIVERTVKLSPTKE